MALKPVTVSQLNEYISRILSTDPLLGNVTVIGEISSLKYHSTGHVYFSIVDANSKINCFLPANYAEKLKFTLDNGMEVTIIGAVNVFKKNGSYSLYVKNVEISGVGNLAIAFEATKKKLEKEHLFDIEHKKRLPKFPKKIGIVTSKTGAALQDILKILKSRNTVVDVVIFPVLVQGDSASRDMADTIDYINEHFNDIELLIIGRGGGSPEDLWAFNEEILARAIYKSFIPIISAVGHEIDFTISDMVADVRAETPTAAAGIAVPDTYELAETIESLKKQLYFQLNNKFLYNKLLIYDYLKEMINALKTEINSADNELNQLKVILEEQNPLNILNNGYAILEDQNSKVITDSSVLKHGEKYKVTLRKGTAYMQLLQIGSENNEQN